MEVGELLQVWVCPEYRSKGVAIEIIDTIFRWAGENGFRTVLASISKGNQGALRFFRKYGFTVVGGTSLHGRDDPVLTKEVKPEQSA